MARFHNLLLVALIIVRCSHKALKSDRGGEKSTGATLPDFTLDKSDSVYSENNIVVFH